MKSMLKQIHSWFLAFYAEYLYCCCHSYCPGSLTLFLGKNVEWNPVSITDKKFTTDLREAGILSRNHSHAVPCPQEGD